LRGYNYCWPMFPRLAPWATGLRPSGAKTDHPHSRRGALMAHTFTRLLVHVIFSTKDRRPVIDGELKPRLLSYLGGIADELGVKELAANAVPDHVHLLLALPATRSVAEVLRITKTNSSRWV